jgi:hypothetical protein
MAYMALLLPSGLAWSACNVDAEQTGATSLMQQSGQGNFACSDLTGKGVAMTGEPMTAIDKPHLAITFGPGNLSIDWQLIGDYEADALIVEAADGKRCIYNYPNNATSGTNLTPGGDKSIKNVTACTDSFFENEPLPPTPPPISTVGDGCQGNISVSCNGDAGCDDFLVVTAHSLENAAVCNGTLAQGDTQTQCVDQCVRRTPDPSCDGLSGELPLGLCAPCELSQSVPADPSDPDLRYCWEYTNKVVLGGDSASGRTAGTFIPQEALQGTSSDTQFFEGTTCYKTTTKLNGRYYTYTTCGPP